MSDLPFEEDTAGVTPVDPDAEHDSAIAGQLVVDVDGFEGPLDVLLVLARSQKVDLRKISILALVEQYLEFIAEIRRLRLELAADYLVMAAWLAYLKSRLLLPEPPADEGPSGEELAQRLAFQLQRLQAMREAAQKLFALPKLGQDVFPRGAPEGIRLERTITWDVTLYELLKAYASQRMRDQLAVLEIRPPAVYRMEEALRRLEAMLGTTIGWARLESFLPEGFDSPVGVRSAVAATFSASLEMVREGLVELSQLEVYGPIYLRRREGAPREGA